MHQHKRRETDVLQGRLLFRRLLQWFCGSLIDLAAWGHIQREIFHNFSVDVCLIEALPIKGCEGFAALFCGVATLSQARHVCHIRIAAWHALLCRSWRLEKWWKLFVTQRSSFSTSAFLLSLVPNLRSPDILSFCTAISILCDL